MSDEIKIGVNLHEKEIYESLLPQVEALLDSGIPVISNLANFTAVLKESFGKISWAGFYLYDGKKLFLGPFQGKLACTTINLGDGVCGTAASKKETLIIDDVNEFPGHIACDSGSRSEIVVPLIKNGALLGVLDLDSYSLSAFGAADKFYLESMIGILVNKLNFENLSGGSL